MAAVFIILMVIILALLIVIEIISDKYTTASNIIDELNYEMSVIKRNCESPEYSHEVLEYLRSFTVEVSAITFRNFIDNHEIEKITKATMTKLVEDTAKIVNESINVGNIRFNDTLFTRKFYDKYIIDISMISIKELLEKAVNKTEED